MDKSEMTGGFTPPPPGAPQETTVAGSERPTAAQIAAARANETELPPFNPGARPMTIEQQAVFLGKTIDEIKAMRAAAGMPTEDEAAEPPKVTAPLPNPAPAPEAALPAGTVLDDKGRPVTSSVRPTPPRPARALRTVHKPMPAEPAPEPAAEPQDPLHGIPAAIDDTGGPFGGIPREAPAVTPPPPDPAKHQPAASNTDSPGRGVPPPMTTLPEGKRITGGFGDPLEAEYYPLDGSELRELIYGLLGQIHDRLQDDLRFSFAVTYPRCRARVAVEIDAFAMDETLTVEKRMVPAHERTPMEVARRYGDEVVFCVVAERAEMTDDGQSIAPPNQTRQELGLPVPRKTAVQTPGGRMLVDVRQ